MIRHFKKQIMEIVNVCECTLKTWAGKKETATQWGKKSHSHIQAETRAHWLKFLNNFGLGSCSLFFYFVVNGCCCALLLVSVNEWVQHWLESWSITTYSSVLLFKLFKSQSVPFFICFDTAIHYEPCAIINSFILSHRFQIACVCEMAMDEEFFLDFARKAQRFAHHFTTYYECNQWTECIRGKKKQ